MVRLIIQNSSDIIKFCYVTIYFATMMLCSWLKILIDNKPQKQTYLVHTVTLK